MASAWENRQPSKLVIGISVTCGLYHLIVVGGLPQHLGIFFSPLIHRAISLLFAITLLLLIFPVSKKAENKKRFLWFDLILILMAAVSLGFVVFFQDQITNYILLGTLDAKGAAFAFILMVVLLECARRSSGSIILPVIIMVVVAITMYGQYMPGVFHSLGFSPKQLGLILYVGQNGFFGIPYTVASTIMIMFIIFSQVLLEIGGSDWFIKLAVSLVGAVTGGIAKVTIVACALFGMISGSPASNSAAIGSVTIPMMKRAGYRSDFSGGLVAAAATGSQIMPPVMGAVAFIIAQWLQISYIQVCLAALVPALLFYAVMFFAADIQTRKNNAQAIPREQIPRFFDVLRSGWYYIIPLVVLIYLLVFLSYPPAMSAFYSIVAIFALSIFINRETKELDLPRSLAEAGVRLKRIVLSVGSGVRLWIRVAVICAAIGIIVGCLTQSGISLQLSSSIIGLAGGHLIIVLILTAVSAYILGMGMDTLPLYITLAILIAPALIKMGVTPIIAHLYVLMWGLTSFYTPPVCMAVFVTSAIAQSSIWKTGLQAMRLGIVLFIIPFALVYLPIALPAPPGDFAIAILKTIIALAAIISGLIGYLFKIKEINWLARVLLIVGGGALFFPKWQVLAIGIFILLSTSLWQWFARKRKSPTEATV